MYVPSEDERKDPALYASNVRQYMLKYSKLTPSDSSYQVRLLILDLVLDLSRSHLSLRPHRPHTQDKLAYHALLKGKGKGAGDKAVPNGPTVTAKAL